MTATTAPTRNARHGDLAGTPMTATGPTHTVRSGGFAVTATLAVRR